MVPRRSAPHRRLARMLAAVAVSCVGLCATGIHTSWTPLAATEVKPQRSPTPAPTLRPTPTPVPTAVTTPKPSESAAPAPSPSPAGAEQHPKPPPSPRADEPSPRAPAAVAAQPSSASPPTTTARPVTPEAPATPSARPAPPRLSQATTVPTTLASYAQDSRGGLSPFVLGADVLAAVAVASSLLLAALRRRGLV